MLRPKPAPAPIAQLLQWAREDVIRNAAVLDVASARRKDNTNGRNGGYLWRSSVGNGITLVGHKRRYDDDRRMGRQEPIAKRVLHAIYRHLSTAPPPARAPPPPPPPPTPPPPQSPPSSPPTETGHLRGSDRGGGGFGGGGGGGGASPGWGSQYVYVENVQRSHLLYALVLPLVARLLATSVSGLLVILQVPPGTEGCSNDVDGGGHRANCGGRGRGGGGSGGGGGGGGGGGSTGDGGGDSDTGSASSRPPLSSSPDPGGATAAASHRLQRLLCNGFEVLTGDSPTRSSLGKDTSGAAKSCTLSSVSWMQAGVALPATGTADPTAPTAAVQIPFSNGTSCTADGVVVTYTNGSTVLLTLRHPLEILANIGLPPAHPVVLFAFDSSTGALEGLVPPPGEATHGGEVGGVGDGRGAMSESMAKGDAARYRRMLARVNALVVEIGHGRGSYDLEEEGIPAEWKGELCRGPGHDDPRSDDGRDRAPRPPQPPWRAAATVIPQADTSVPTPPAVVIPHTVPLFFSTRARVASAWARAPPSSAPPVWVTGPAGQPQMVTSTIPGVVVGGSPGAASGVPSVPSGVAAVHPLGLPPPPYFPTVPVAWPAAVAGLVSAGGRPPSHPAPSADALHQYATQVQAWQKYAARPADVRPKVPSVAADGGNASEDGGSDADDGVVVEVGVAVPHRDGSLTDDGGSCKDRELSDRSTTPEEGAPPPNHPREQRDALAAELAGVAAPPTAGTGGAGGGYGGGDDDDDDDDDDDGGGGGSGGGGHNRDAATGSGGDRGHGGAAPRTSAGDGRVVPTAYGSSVTPFNPQRSMRGNVGGGTYTATGGGDGIVGSGGGACDGRGSCGRGGGRGSSGGGGGGDSAVTPPPPPPHADHYRVASPHKAAALDALIAMKAGDGLGGGRSRKLDASASSTRSSHR